MKLSIDEFGKMFESIQSSVFRLQMLDNYDVEFERKDFDAFISGEPSPNRAGNSWLNTIASAKASKKEWINVHLLSPELTPYLRYIIDWWYVYQSAAGADVRFVLANAVDELRRISPRDFWLFDDATVVWMHYDGNGKFIEPDLSSNGSDLILARRIRECACSIAVDLRKVLSLRRTGSLI